MVIPFGRIAFHRRRLDADILVCIGVKALGRYNAKGRVRRIQKTLDHGAGSSEAFIVNEALAVQFVHEFQKVFVFIHQRSKFYNAVLHDEIRIVGAVLAWNSPHTQPRFKMHIAAGGVDQQGNLVHLAVAVAIRLFKGLQHFVQFIRSGWNIHIYSFQPFLIDPNGAFQIIGTILRNAGQRIDVAVLVRFDCKRLRAFLLQRPQIRGQFLCDVILQGDQYAGSGVGGDVRFGDGNIGVDTVAVISGV